MLKGVASLALLAVAGACATPGASYLTEAAPDALAVTEYRTVAVQPFRGRIAGPFEADFLVMIAEAESGGAPWYQLEGRSGPLATGVFSGSAEIMDVRVEPYTREERQCVEWDGLFDCERRETVLVECERTFADVSVTVTLRDADTRQLVYSRTADATGEDEACGDGRGGWGAGGWRAEPPLRLAREAARTTLDYFRDDLTPRMIEAKAPFVTETDDPVLSGDNRFALAVEAAKRDRMVEACSLWSALAASSEPAAEVLLNAGACAEAAGDFAAAQEAYASAERRPLSERTSKALRDALIRIDRRRTDRAVLLAPPADEDGLSREEKSEPLL